MSGEAAAAKPTMMCTARRIGLRPSAVKQSLGSTGADPLRISKWTWGVSHCGFGRMCR